MSVDIAYEVADYIADAGFGVLGTTIFVGQIPDDKNGIWVERSGGQLNNYLPIEETVVDIYCKHINSSEAILTLENLKRYIHRMNNTQAGSSYVYTFLVIGDIQDIQRDIAYDKIYKITLQVVHRNTSLIS